MPKLQWEVMAMVIIGHKQPTYSYKSGSVKENFRGATFVSVGSRFC